MTKVNEFIDKNNINGTTKLSKKTPSLKIMETELSEVVIFSP
ncbi:hypothetical protein [Bathymodiolus japonicus methanotrophic gill symbiont]|nr:hypothetical protein [Bathymodiolus japonicus methanotrophic gill symbiont]